MTRFLSLSLCILLVLSLAISASAEVDNGDIVIFTEETIMEGGLTVVDEVIEHTQTRASAKNYTRRKSFYDGDTLIATIAFTATFHYDGSTVSVASKSVTQTDTYEGWSYKQDSFTSSGGTVTLSGKLTKWLIFNSSFSMGLVCDVNGNISAT